MVQLPERILQVQRNADFAQKFVIKGRSVNAPSGKEAKAFCSVANNTNFAGFGAEPRTGDKSIKKLSSLVNCGEIFYRQTQSSAVMSSPLNSLLAGESGQPEEVAVEQRSPYSDVLEGVGVEVDESVELAAQLSRTPHFT